MILWSLNKSTCRKRTVELLFCGHTDKLLREPSGKRETTKQQWLRITVFPTLITTLEGPVNRTSWPSGGHLWIGHLNLIFSLMIMQEWHLECKVRTKWIKTTSHWKTGGDCPLCEGDSERKHAKTPIRVSVPTSPLSLSSLLLFSFFPRSSQTTFHFSNLPSQHAQRWRNSSNVSRC